MYYLALACDYDGTLAKDGVVSSKTIEVLERVGASGRKLILVTGRLLEDLQQVFPRLELFTYVVAENGALLYHPASSTEQLLGEAPPRQFLQALQGRGVPLSTGRVIVATWHPHETTVVEVIGKLGLERQVIFNKGAVMVLPTGVNKGTGLAAALREMMFSAHNVVGIGDAENDHSFLSMCECSVAVANALPALKEQTDYTTKADHGDGVVELIEQLLADDLKTLDQRIKPAQSKQEPQRHRRKYAEGDLGEDNCFYFRGPEGKLKLRAQNLALFAQIAQGVDDETWLFHLRKGDYSRWLREVIKDPDLAAEGEKVEKDEKLSASESRARILEAIEQRYTLPA